MTPRWNRFPTLPAGVRRLFRLPLSRSRLMRDADEEMQFHLDMWMAEFRAAGLSDVDALAAARRRFGDADEYREYFARRASRNARWQRMADWLAEWRQDARFARRHFHNAPAFTAIAVVTLALGIGANTAIFSVVHRLLIAPLPYPNGDRVVALKTLGASRFTAGLVTMSANAPGDPPRPLMHAWADRATHAFDAMAGVEQIYLSILPNDQQDTVSHALITANFLSMLGVQPAFGRAFRADEEARGNDHVAMISYDWWQAAYDGRPDVLGKSAEFEGNPYTVVGVMPRGFTVPMSPRLLDGLWVPSPDVWMPGRLRDMEMAFGLLRPGVSIQDATRELQSIANTPEARGVGGPSGLMPPLDSVRARAMRAQDFLAVREVRTIEVLFVAVGALLLIACANVANLLLVRAWARRREFAVRMGLGAGRARLVRLALTESLLLAIAAGVVGVAIAWEALRAIVALRPITLDQLGGVSVETPILLWTGGISILTGILFGGAAAAFVGSQNVADLLRNETRSTSGGETSRRVRSSLIVAEIALSVALLVGTGLLVRSFAALQETPIGFDPHNLVSVDVLVGPNIRHAGQDVQTRDAIIRRLHEIPGVVDAAIGSLPTAGFRDRSALEVQTDAGARRVDIGQYQRAWVNGDYFRTANIPLIGGRPPRVAPTDDAPAQTFGLSEEIVVSRSLARRISHDGNVVGMRMRAINNALTRGPPPPVGGTTPSAAPVDAWSTIVGVAEDVHLPGPRGDLETYQVYQMPVRRMPEPIYVLRFASVPPNVESFLRKTIQTVNPTIVTRRARLADDYLREALAPTRFSLALLGAFAFVALVLSVVGLYGSIAYGVTQRTREIGIRIALGATPRVVTASVVGEGVRLVVIGLAAGVALAFAVTRTLTSLLYSVTSSDPATYVVIARAVGVIALVASYVPARRAARIDPVDALRAD
ncbi:MAG TPA: ABC transporter permease [Gemmatimonadaceae bacterium]|nr:ABC transporter permease [Gemmatimonadaceae bacterium]